MTLRASLFALGAAAAARTAAGAWLGFRPFDDTYITFRYSLNLASGHGFVYNLGEPVLGTTAPLWAMVLALAAAAGASIEQAALAFSLGCDAASAFLLFQLLRAVGLGAGIPLAGGLLFLGIFDYLSLARSGMESSFFVFLVLGSLASMASRRIVAAAVFAGLAALTRPEGALLPVLLAAVLWHHRANLSRRDGAIAIAVLLAIVGSWTAYATLTFGSPVPQSVVAKAAAFEDPALAQFSWNNIGLFFLRGQYGGEVFTRTYFQLMPVMSLLAALGAVWLLMWLNRNRREAIPRVALLLFFPAAYVAGLSISHAFTYFPWYYAPVYPFLAALAPIGVFAIARGSENAVLSVAGVLIAAQIGAAALVKVPADVNFWIEGYADASDAVLRREPDVLVAAPEIGVVGWRVWPATILDMEGLVTPAAVGVQPGDFLRQKRPDYLILRTDNAADLLQSLGHDGWFAGTYVLVKTRRDPTADREFQMYKKKGEE